jgi:integrase
MRCCGDGPHGDRARGLIAVLWRAGLRIHQALDLGELDLDALRGSGWSAAAKAAVAARSAWTTGVLSNSSHGCARVRRCRAVRCSASSTAPGCGRAWHASAARAALHRRAARTGVRRRFAPHQLRHAHALELLREGVPLNVIQRQLGHRNLGVTSIYLQGIDPEEIIETVHARRPPMIPASMELALSRGR